MSTDSPLREAVSRDRDVMVRVPRTRRERRLGRRILSIPGSLLSGLASRPVLAFLVTLVAVWLGTFILAATMSITYDSRAVVAFEPRDANVAGAETMVLVTPKYVELLRSPEVIETAARQLGMSVDEIRSASTGVIEPNTLNLRVQAKGADPARVAEVANVLAAGVLAVSARDPLLSAEMVAWAVPAASPTPPVPTQVRAIGLLLGVVAGTVMGVVVLRRTSAVRDRLPHSTAQV